MIGKITKGGGFGGVLGYALEKDGAEFLATNCISDPADPAALAQEMAEHAARERPNLVKPVLHVALSAAPGERLTDDQWRAVADAYRKKMGLTNSQYVLVRHTDTGHDHVHLIINRVDFDGRTLTDSNDFARQEAALDEIEQQFGLTRVREALREAIRENPTVVLDNLLSQRNRVTENQIRRAVARSIYDPAERDALVKRIVTDTNTVYLGRDDKGRDLYSTREVVAEWQGLKQHLTVLTERRVSVERVTDVKRSDLTLSDEQRAAVSAVTAGRGLSVVTGYAGAGKSTMLDAARREWEAQGKDVLGCAVAGKAAKGLQDSAGIESNTIASTLNSLENGRITLSERSVLVVDEAGMVEAKQLAALAAHVERAGGQLVLVGDSRQLRPVGRGGAFDMARELAGETTLETVRRQSIDWQREAAVAFGQGRAADAVQSYLDHGRVTWSASRGSARAALVRDYVAECDKGIAGKDLLAMAHTRDDVARLNSDIRAELVARGALTDERSYVIERKTKDSDGTERTARDELRLAVGERVVMLRNDREVDVKNGEFATVTATGAGVVRLRFDDGRDKALHLAEYGDIQHGYAATYHKSQGASIGAKTFELLTPGMDAHTTDVGLTRHKGDTQAYAGRTDFPKDRDLVKTLSRRPEPDGLDLNDTDTADLEIAYDAAKRDLGAATWAAPHVESINQAHLFRHAAEATRIGADALRLLPGSDLARAAGSGLGGSLHDLPRRIEYVEHNRAMRGLSDDSGRREQTASRSRDMSAPSSATRAFAYWHTADPTRYTLEERDGQLVGVDHTANTEAVLTDSAGKPLPASAREDVEIQGELDHADLWHGAEQDAEAEEALGKGRELSL